MTLPGYSATGGTPDSSATIESIVDQLAENGWCVIDNALPKAMVETLVAECEALWHEGEFQRAGVGRGGDLKIREAIRTDRVLWLDPNATPKASAHYQEFLAGLRRSITRGLFLPLDDWEGHFAIYPEGAFYKMHLDQHKDTAARQITTILYLNENWQPEDGGHLRLYLDDERHRHIDIAPDAGRLVVFLAGRFWHEVLPAHRERKSITGWFRRGEVPVHLQ